MRKIPFSLALALALTGAAARADLMIEIQHHQDPSQIMRQKVAAVDEVVQQWIGKDRTARLGGATGIIVRLDQKKVYIIDHAKKTFFSLDLPLDLSAAMAPEMKEAMKAMQSMFKFDVSVKPTSETKSVAGFSSKLYEVVINGPMGLKIEQKLWATRELEPKMDVAAYKELFNTQMAMLGPMGGDWWKKLSVIEGYPVLTEMKTTMMGSTVAARDEVTSATEKAAPAGTYDPPAGYTEKPFDPMGASQKR
jgi:hypothetical protein